MLVKLKKIEPHAGTNLDLDWFYRMGGRAFLWLARKPVQSADTGVGEVYRVGGLVPLMKSAGLVGRFDNRVIDGAVDGLASAVRGAGARLRFAQRGALQENLTFVFAVAAILLLGFVIFLLMTPPGSTEGLPLLSILIFAPLAVAAVAALIRSERGLRWWTLAGTTAIALFSLQLWTGFTLGTADFQFVEHAAWIPGLKINYTVGIDGISLLLVLLTTLIAPLCVLASWSYIKTRVREFMLCLLIMETAMIGVFCALDSILFFVFWEAMLIPMALLIGVWGGPRKIYASLKFFIYTMAGSIFLLVALIALRLQTGTFHIPDLMGQHYDPAFQCWIFAAFFISFAIKVPMFPFHTWLPAAHVEAPTAGSVLLASVLLKMGTYGFLRFCLPIVPYAHPRLRALCPLAVRDRHPLRRFRRPGPERPQEARRLFLGRPHGFRHARHLRPQRARASRAPPWS